VQPEGDTGMRLFKSYEFKRSLLSTTGVMVILPLIVLVNVVFSFFNLRFDATQDKVYSLSEGSRHYLSQIQQKVTIKYYWSRSDVDFPRDLRIYAGQVNDFLSELEHASNGKITVEQYDPKPDSDEEELAQKYGLRAIPSPQGYSSYCGLVFVSGDREEKMAALDPGRQELLEYDIMHVLNVLKTPNRKVIGVISDLPIFGNPASEQALKYWAFVDELKKTYELKDLPPNTEVIDPGTNLLLIFHPKTMSRKLQFAVDQYVLGGGNVLVFVDPFSMADTTRFGEVSPPLSSIQELFKAWGVSTTPTNVIVDFGQSTQIRGAAGRPEDNPLFLSIGPETLNRDNVLTSKLGSLLIGVCGAIQKAPDSPYEFEPLIFSTQKAGITQPIELSKPVAEFKKTVTVTGEKYILAAQVRGIFKTAFPDGPGKDPAKPGVQPEADDKPAGSLREGKAKSTIVIVADTDLLADVFFIETGMQQGVQVSRFYNDNFNFLANACELLTGDEDLITLRTRGKFQRPFTRVVALYRTAQDRWLAKEQELARQGEETNKKLLMLQRQKDDSQKQILSKEQEEEIRKFQDEKRKLDKELKEVRRQFNSEIEALGTTLKLINIFLIPVCVALAGLGYAFFRHRRMKNQ
jgi:ABC-type uncharacterized transport system involved in gliding motility auxiliary subunit